MKQPNAKQNGVLIPRAYLKTTGVAFAIVLGLGWLFGSCNFLSARPGSEGMVARAALESLAISCASTKISLHNRSEEVDFVIRGL